MEHLERERACASLVLIDVLERLETQRRAMLVAICPPDCTLAHAEELLDELAELADTYGAEACARQIVRLAKPQARFLIGSGRAEGIVEACREQKLDLIVFDEDLSASQQRNWEKMAEMPVIDRHEVILEIFGRRARTREAKLQIQLAQAEYSLPRLKRAWTHLSRQQGGVGVRGGEGEKQIEIDGRLVRNRITRLKRELEAVKKQRTEERKKRKRLPVPTAAIVGYTNAGKSSLLNRLTNAEAFVEDKLFATLDPTTRRLILPNNQNLLLTDTVGFIRKLPHDLVESFKSTLEEAADADFLLHVVDCTNPQAEDHITTTEEVLAEIGADDLYRILVFNKIDAVEDDFILSRFRRRHPEAFFVSVHAQLGLEPLLDELAQVLAQQMGTMQLRIPQARYDVVASIHRSSQVLEEVYEGSDVLIDAVVPDRCRHEYADFVDAD